RGIAAVAHYVPVVFPVHPRTRPAVSKSVTAAALIETNRLRLVDPLGYLDFIGLMERARVVLTDSGGIQEETTILGVPCLTLREYTERPVTITHGTNHLVGTDTTKTVEAWASVKVSSTRPAGPSLWDRHAAERIVSVLANYFARV